MHQEEDLNVVSSPSCVLELLSIIMNNSRHEEDWKVKFSMVMFLLYSVLKVIGEHLGNGLPIAIFL